ncbi:recombinase A [Pendulispora brunnea]|uniref:Recombinase A n=1 Tax=Pendulispora brunnea TaxID=2905690 RepID=A0ABZ2KPS1_9BACT
MVDLLARLGSRVEAAENLVRDVPSLPLDWPELDALLPDGGLPHGVVELTAPQGLGGTTALALAAVRAAHARDTRAWCAWVDPEGTLHAPGVVQAGVDLARLLVVRPPRSELARVAVTTASAKAFEVLVVDYHAVPGAIEANGPARSAPKKRAWPEVVFIRKLALAAAEAGTSALLLTDAAAPRAQPWPVALRLELARTVDAMVLRVGKDARGRVGMAKTIPLRSRPQRRSAG